MHGCHTSMIVQQMRTITVNRAGCATCEKCGTRGDRDHEVSSQFDFKSFVNNFFFHRGPAINHRNVCGFAQRRDPRVAESATRSVRYFSSGGVPLVTRRKSSLASGVVKPQQCLAQLSVTLVESDSIRRETFPELGPSISRSFAATSAPSA